MSVREARRPSILRQRRLQAGLLVGLTFVTAVVLVVWMLARMRLIDVGAWWQANLANVPVIGPAFETYRLGAAREAELTSRKAELKARAQALDAEADRLEAEREQLASEWELLEQTRQELEALRAELEAKPPTPPPPEPLADEGLLFEVVAAMDPEEAAPIVAQFDDPQIARLIEFLPPRQAARLLAELDPARIARLSTPTSR